MKTEDIEYNGQIFSCHKIIDISSMIELLSLLAKKQEYLEKKLDFQEERINDKDKRIAELEIMIKGFSLSKEEKFPSEKEIKDDFFDDGLDDYLKDDNNKIEEIKLENKNDIKDIKEEKEYESKNEEKKSDIKEDKKEEIKENKNEEIKEEKIDEDKKEEKIDEDSKYDDNNQKNLIKKEEEEKIEDNNKENIEKLEKNEIKEKEDIKEEKVINKEEEEKKIDINIIPTSTPIEIKRQTLSNKENPQTLASSPVENKITTTPQPIAAINLQDDEVIKKIVKKLKLLESKIDKLQQNETAIKSQAVAAEKANKSKLEGRMNLLNNKFEELESNQKKMKEEMNKIKEKVDDFNVYDLFKGNTGDGNVDIAKALIQALENKVFKKFGFYDLKFKKNEEDIFQNKNDINNLNNLINTLKEKTEKLGKDLSDILSTNDDKYAEINNYINEVNTKMKDIDKKINSNNNNNNALLNNNVNSNYLNDNNNINNNEGNLLNNELRDRLDELEEKIIEIQKNIELTKSSKTSNNSQNQDYIKALKDLNTRIIELEKNMKTILGQMNIKEIYDRLDTLEKDLFKKSNKYETNEINEKISAVEENEKDLNFKMDSLQQFSEKIRGDNQQIVKKIEFLSGQMNRISVENADLEKGKGPIIDINKFVDLNTFNEKNKEINKKFDKIRLSFEEIARNMDDILQKLSHVPTDVDFAQFQSIIKNSIDELKLSLSKKYAEKNETNKSMKFIETQIKTIQESFQKKLDGADNWLLAKKPLNNYVCASCESIIKGELDKKSEFVPWNKYPNREEKSYRFGHGFSRMLQLINEDRKKELKEKDSISDEERSRGGGSDSEPMFKLPKLKRHHINSGKLKINMGMLNSDDDNNNIPFEKYGPYNNEIEPILSDDRPKIMKIFKRNKNVAQSGYLNKIDKIKDNKDSLTNLITKTSPTIPNIPNIPVNKENNPVIQTENNVPNNED